MLERWPNWLQAESDKRNAAYRQPAERCLEKVQPFFPDVGLIGAFEIWTGDPNTGGSGSVFDLAIGAASFATNGQLKRRILVVAEDKVFTGSWMESRRQRMRPMYKRLAPTSQFDVLSEHYLHARGLAEGDINVTVTCGGRDWHVEAGFADEARQLIRYAAAFSQMCGYQVPGAVGTTAA